MALFLTGHVVCVPTYEFFSVDSFLFVRLIGDGVDRGGVCWTKCGWRLRKFKFLTIFNIIYINLNLKVGFNYQFKFCIQTKRINQLGIKANPIHKVIVDMYSNHQSQPIERDYDPRVVGSQLKNNQREDVLRLNYQLK